MKQFVISSSSIRTWVRGLILSTMTVSSLNAGIILTPIPGNEGRSTATAVITIDPSGSPSIKNDFTVSGRVSAPEAFGQKFSFTISAVGSTSNSGACLREALIDRDESGKLGVRGGTNGIDASEGFLIGINAGALKPGYAWQLTGIGFEYIGGDESFTILNRNTPSRRVTGTSNHMVNVSELGLRVHGGSADAEIASVFANTTVDGKSSFRIKAFELDVIQVSQSPDSPWRSALYPADWQPPTQASFYQDKLIQDFSYAGYHRGEAAIPQIRGPLFDVIAFGADPTGAADSTAAIKAALSAAGKAGGGVVSLPPGTFKISKTKGSELLKISSNGVILRGSGPDKTFLMSTTATMRNLATIRILGLNPTEGPSIPITTDITTPTKRIHLANVSAFAPGNLVEILRDFTTAWINEHGQQSHWNPNSKTPEPANYRRLVTAVNPSENWIEIDIPMRYTCLTRDKSRVRKLSGQITECGIENLSIGNVQHPGSQWGETAHDLVGTGAYNLAYSSAIDIQHAMNCWVSNVKSFRAPGNASTSHIPSNGIRIGSSKNITVTHCHFQKPQYGGGAGNGYMYRLQNSDDCLVADSIAEFSRHGFVVSHSGSTGNVFLRCEDRLTGRAVGSTSGGYSTGGDGSDNHMHFSHSNLWDQCRAVDSFYEAIFRVTGNHGLSSAHCVYWNTSGFGTAFKNKLIVTEQGRYGYVIGTSGPINQVIAKDPARYNTQPADHIEGESLGATLFPPSLYQDQLERRLRIQMTAPKEPEKTIKIKNTPGAFHGSSATPAP